MLRRQLFYPLNYGAVNAASPHGVPCRLYGLMVGSFLPSFIIYTIVAEPIPRSHSGYLVWPDHYYVVHPAYNGPITREQCPAAPCLKPIYTRTVECCQLRQRPPRPWPWPWGWQHRQQPRQSHPSHGHARPCSPAH
jgi:hypothetical protein